MMKIWKRVTLCAITLLFRIFLNSDIKLKESINFLRKWIPKLKLGFISRKFDEIYALHFYITRSILSAKKFKIPCLYTNSLLPWIMQKDVPSQNFRLHKMPGQVNQIILPHIIMLKLISLNLLYFFFLFVRFSGEREAVISYQWDKKSKPFEIRKVSHRN